MNIQSIRYSDEEHTSLTVTTDTGTMTVPWPCKTWHREVIEEWLDSNIIDEWTDPTPLSDKVTEERDRRIKLGFTATTSGSQTFPVDTRNEVDFRNLNGLGSASQVRLAQNDTTEFSFRAADNVSYTLTPQEMLEVAMQALAHVDAHYKAAWHLKDEEIEDYLNETYWPEL